MTTLFLVYAALALASPEGGQHHHAQLGKVSFDSSCNARAKPYLERGLGWLHSFEYPEAEREFSRAAAADSTCVIAHWGVAMTYYHPLWVPPTQTELEKARAALAKARATPAKTKREQDYIAAIGSFYDGSESLDHKTRALAYNAAMARMHSSYPKDREAAVFYALSQIAVGTLDADPTFAREKDAGRILNAVLNEEPDHPGVAHYLIHSFDYPPLAELALPAARRYASIAPASAHAQHMPSHIFVRLGLWDEAIKSNVASAAAAQAAVQAAGFAGASREQLHAMDYLAYAYLQMGRDAEARRVWSELSAMHKVDEPVFSVAFAASAIPARILLEQRQWTDAASLRLPDNVRGLASFEKFRWADAHIHFARAIGAARTGNSAAARDEVASLRAIEESITIPPGTYDWRKQVSIQRQIAEAWLAHVEGRKEQSVALMRAAADLDDVTEKHPVTPGALLPAREQLGELLLELDRPAEAVPEFEKSLQRAPRRLGGLYGAARASMLAGDSAKARRYFGELAAMTRGGDSSRTEVREALAMAAELAQR